MPSHFKYRIKKTSESTKSVWDYDSVPEELKRSYLDTGVFFDQDKRIYPSTCAFISKVLLDGTPKYLCGIKMYRRRADLIASDTRSESTTQTPDGSGESRVSGALDLGYTSELGSLYCNTHFQCKYFDPDSANTAKEGVGVEETVLFPMCNCYTPRGGLAITHFDGAVRNTEAVGYSPEEGVSLPSAYGVYKGTEEDPYFSGPIPKYITDNAKQRYPQHPPKLGYIFMMLNARATLVPCCWWKGKSPIIYKTEYFRAIDLAVAQEYFKKKADNKGENRPRNSSRWGVSNFVDYVYREGDYFYPNEGENYLKNILLGRNYDQSLPDCGNNQRIIYTLDAPITSKLVQTPVEGDTDCQDIPWHFDSGTGFSPKNCSHPDCHVKYQWGSVCNGGGAFDLANGRACPYYENPLMGPEAESTKLCTLNRMYAGDAITGAALLEMMWFSKGGLPWTAEEWESVWRVPYIWSTIPFNPQRGFTDTFRDSSGNIIKIDEAIIPELKVYAVKTTVDLNTGKSQQDAPKLLPGGSVTQFKKDPGSGKLRPADRVPDLPTLIQEIEMKPMGTLNVTWPLASLSLLGLDVERSEDFADKLKKLKEKTYKHLVWGPDSRNILVMGYGSAGQYVNGVYCINTAMLVGEWKEKKDRLIEHIKNMNILSPTTQTMLTDLWRSLLKSQAAGADKVIDGMEMQRSLLDSRGMFTFKSVPLNLLYKDNLILIFGFSSSTTIDATYTIVTPVFRRAHLYQSKGSLMTGWKATWNGRPSLFLDESDLVSIAGEDYKDQKGRKIDVTVVKNKVPSANLTGTETLEELTEKADLITQDLKDLNVAYVTVEDPVVKGNYVNQIASQQAALMRIKELIRAKTSQTSLAVSATEVQDAATERSKLEGAIEEIDREIKHLEAKRDAAYSSGFNDLSSFFGSIIAELNYDKGVIQRQLDTLPAEGTTIEPTTDDDEWDPNWALAVDYEIGDEDTDEGGSLDTTDPQAEEDVQAGEGDLARLYVPFLNYRRSNQKNIDKFTSVLPSQEQDPPTLEILEDSGVAKWKYFEIKRENDEISAPLKPWKAFAPKGAKRAVVYTTHDFDSNSLFQGVQITDTIGRWYVTASCSSMLLLVLNPELANRHNEFMIFNMWAEVEYAWKGADGSEQTLSKKIKFVPYNYTQINRMFPAYSSGKTAEMIGTMEKFGVNHQKISVSENIEILEKAEGNRHPWVFFAIACDEKSDIKTWPSYNGQWYPGGDVRVTTIPQKKEKVKIYLDYAFIGEVYDQDDREFDDWEEGEEEHGTRILFNHPKAGTIRSVFTVGEGEVGSYSDTEEGFIDGYKRVPVGSSASTTLWPYARLACRDFEMHYVWRDDEKAEQITENFIMQGKGDTGPRKTIGDSKRYTSYAHGDHDLGTVFSPKISIWDRGEVSDVGYSWQTGSQVAAGDPTDGFPSEAGESKTPGNKMGPLYYPYTRSEPHSKFVPIHPIYIWDFLVNYRNKPKQVKYFGGFRMMAPATCAIGTPETRGNTTWNVSYKLDPKKTTEYLGRCRTRGPLFQLEYEDYEEKKPKTVFFSPFGVRDVYTHAETWIYYLRAESTADEEWTPTTYEAPEAAEKVADNPNSLTRGVWKAICRSLFNSWSNGDESAYWDLVAQQNWGAKRSWEVQFTSGLVFPDEQKYVPPDPPDANEDRRRYLKDRIEFYKNWIVKLEEENAKVSGDPIKSKDYDTQIEESKAIIARLQEEMDDLGGDPDYQDDSGQQEETSPEAPEEAETLQIDLVTGCNKTTLQDIGQKGSFFFDNTYMPGSVTSEGWREKVKEEEKDKMEKLQKTRSRVYYYEQKSFGMNTPWSPYDSPPLFGNTGRELYIVELCTIGSVISWLPTTDDKLGKVRGRSNVPSWWTSRTPEGDPKELITLLPPPAECTRAIKALAAEPQNPYYGYIFDSGPFNEDSPNYDEEYKPHEVRIATKYSTDNYGKSWYRSDAGRMTLTVTPESKLSKISVYGDSPATKESVYTSVTTPSIVQGDSSKASPPNAGDVEQDGEAPKNSLWGKDIRGLAIESGQTVSVGQLFPGYYSPYNHGRSFVGFRKDRSGRPIHWAWPKSDRDILKRGTKVVKWWPDVIDLSSPDKTEVQLDVKKDYQLGPLSSIQCAPYMQKFPTADDGREVNLGPELKKGSQIKGEKEVVYADVTYYAIVIESERNQGGVARPPIMWARQIDSPDEAESQDKFKRPTDGSVAYKVNWDGSVTAVSIGKDQTKDEVFTTGFLFPRTIRNSVPAGNFIVSDTMNEAGRYPSFELGTVSYRHAGKSFVTKDLTPDSNVLKRTKVIKTKNRYGYNNHLVEATLKLPSFGNDAMYLELTLKEFFYDSINNLFINRNDGAALELIVTGAPLAGTDYSDKNYYKSYSTVLPTVDPENKKIYYDLDLGMAKNLELKFNWYIRCMTDEFDNGPWKGDETKVNPSTNKIEPVPENIVSLAELIDKITFGMLVPGKCLEVVEIKEAPFIVSTGAQCKKDKTPYHFFTEVDPEWYKCTWEESDRESVRKWDQSRLYKADQAAKGAPKTDDWARAGYEQMVESFQQIGLNYNKNPQAAEFPDSCVELPELPQSRLKIQAWEDNIGKDEEGRNWTWGGAWTTRIAGPEWKTVDPLPSRDFIWWPAPPYDKGEIIMKGRAWFFGDQYKDEAKVMADKREANKDDQYNQLAYKNEMNAYDKLVRNIQEFEIYRATARKSQASQAARNKTDIANRKQAATQASLDSMYQKAGSGMPGGAPPAPFMGNGTRNYRVNEQKFYTYLDEVGLTPDKASWPEIKEREDTMQKSLYEEAAKLGSDQIENEDSIYATAIVPYYEWEAIRILTGKDWHEKNGEGDYAPITTEELADMSDGECQFVWKSWSWEEVASFTFRDEQKFKFVPGAGDLSTSGLLRYCGRRWTIFDKSVPKKNIFTEVAELLEGETKEALNSAMSSAKADQTKTAIQTGLDDIAQAVIDIKAMGEYYAKLGQTLWGHISTKMPADMSRVHSYVKSQPVIDALSAAITKAPLDQTKINDVVSSLAAIKVNSREVNKALIKAREALTKIPTTIDLWKPQFTTVKEKMEYFNNVTEELRTNSVRLVGALGISTRDVKVKTGIIDCHGEDDTEPKGECDKDGYEQKWFWNTESDTSQDWVDAMSDDSGKSLKRPDPWWRY